MSALLLCRGDIAARHMLKNMLKRRYGTMPPTLQDVIVDFQGHIHQDTPDGKNVAMADATAMFQFPHALRWDFVSRTGENSVQTSEAFNGQRLYRNAEGRKTRVITDVDELQGTIRRFWAMAALFITPLTGANIELKAVDWTRFYFREEQFGSQILVRIDKRFHIEAIQTHCYNPLTGQMEVYSIIPSTDVTDITGLRFPKMIQTFWGDKLHMSLRPISVTIDFPVPANMFHLAYETNMTAPLKI